MKCVFVCVFILFGCTGCEALRGIFQIIPDDVPMGMVAIFGFSPPLHIGRDHRVGFGFRFGNHADLQLMYEFGPQLRTKPLQPIKVRSAAYRTAAGRRRPLVDLLFRAGLLTEEIPDEEDLENHPR